MNRCVFFSRDGLAGHATNTRKKTAGKCKRRQLAEHAAVIVVPGIMVILL